MNTAWIGGDFFFITLSYLTVFHNSTSFGWNVNNNLNFADSYPLFYLGNGSIVCENEWMFFIVKGWLKGWWIIIEYLIKYFILKGC
jgi:hypothetical protein